MKRTLKLECSFISSPIVKSDHASLIVIANPGNRQSSRIKNFRQQVWLVLIVVETHGGLGRTVSCIPYPVGDCLQVTERVVLVGDLMTSRVTNGSDSSLWVPLDLNCTTAIAHNLITLKRDLISSSIFNRVDVTGCRIQNTLVSVEGQIFIPASEDGVSRVVADPACAPTDIFIAVDLGQ